MEEEEEGDGEQEEEGKEEGQRRGRRERRMADRFQPGVYLHRPTLCPHRASTAQATFMLMWWSSASNTRAPPGFAIALAAVFTGRAIAVPVARSMCMALLPAPSAQGLTLVQFQLNVSAFCGIEGALRVCSGVILRVFRRCRGVWEGVGGLKGVFCDRYGSG